MSEKLFNTKFPCLKTGRAPLDVQNGLFVTVVCKGTPENFAYA